MNVKSLVAVVALMVIWDWRCDAATLAVKLCGRQLGDIMSKICHVYNSPSWDVPTVVEQPAPVVRRRRRTGIADECCAYGCTYEQLTSYCAISAKPDSSLESVEEHMMEARSAEGAARGGGRAAEREVGRRSRGYGRGPRGRCWCRKRRSGRRRSSLMGARKKCRSRCSRAGHGLSSAYLGQNPQH